MWTHVLLPVLLPPPPLSVTGMCFQNQLYVLLHSWRRGGGGVGGGVAPWRSHVQPVLTCAVPLSSGAQRRRAAQLICLMSKRREKPPRPSSQLQLLCHRCSRSVDLARDSAGRHSPSIRPTPSSSSAAALPGRNQRFAFCLCCLRPSVDLTLLSV